MIATACLLAALAAAAAPPGRRTGTVVYATQRRLYLDAGTRDGLAPGQVLQLRRDGRAAGACTVESAAETQATCAGNGVAGETFAVSPPAAPLAPPVQRPAPPEPVRVIAQRKAAVVSAAWEKVDFHHGAGDLGPPLRAEVVVAHATWAATGAGPWHQERADVNLRGARLGGGFALDLEMSARRWSLRSDPISFRPGDPTQLYVWNAAISRNPLDSGPALSVGRVRPRFMPGQVILDGAQAGWRTGPGSEAGIFGGAVPDDVTLSPSLQHGTFGAYWAGQHAGDAASPLRLFRHEARVAFVNTAALGKRMEGEALVQLWLTKRFDAAANVRVGATNLFLAAPGSRSTTSLDAVRIDGNLMASDQLSFTGGFRYEGLSIPELDGPANVRLGGSARHADLSAQWEPITILRLSAVSGLSTDLTSNETRRWIGPEIGSPALLGGRVSVSAGYLEEQGWAKGRSTYFQVSGGGRSRVQVIARLSWFHTISGLAPEATDDLGIFCSVRAQLTRSISLRLAAMGRSSLNGGRSVLGGPATTAGWLDGALAGEF